jgi:hypothetical protein
MSCTPPAQRRLAWSICLLALCCLLLPVHVPAQYQVYSWESFENGIIPKNLKQYHLMTPTALVPIDMASGPEPLPGLRSPAALGECGRFVMRMTTPAMGADKKQPILSLISDTVMDRARLGPNGKALFQADIYVMPKATANPNIAVLAYAGSAPDRSWIKMYRFGLSKGDRVAFSYSGDSENSRIIKEVALKELGMTVPGWHRFQIIFEGQENIICAVDGKPTSFSPVKQSSLSKLQPGLMLSSAAEAELAVYADNLSIQWTADEVPIPASPWAGAVNASRPQTAQDVQWVTSPSRAWDRARTEHKPMLVLFYAPTVKAWQSLDRQLATDPAASKLLSRFVPLKMDTNQLQGGSVAQKYSVVRLPTFMVLAADGKERKKLVYSEKARWEELVAELDALATP